MSGPKPVTDPLTNVLIKFCQNSDEDKRARFATELKKLRDIIADTANDNQNQSNTTEKDTFTA